MKKNNFLWMSAVLMLVMGLAACDNVDNNQ